MANWHEKVNPKLRSHLETQIAETRHARDAYLGANDPAIAQLWVAIAGLSRQCFELNVKISNIDTALRDSILQQQAALARSSTKIKKKKVKNIPKRKTRIKMKR